MEQINFLRCRIATFHTWKIFYLFMYCFNMVLQMMFHSRTVATSLIRTRQILDFHMNGINMLLKIATIRRLVGTVRTLPFIQYFTSDRCFQWLVQVGWLPLIV